MVLLSAHLGIHLCAGSVFVCLCVQVRASVSLYDLCIEARLCPCLEEQEALWGG